MLEGSWAVKGKLSARSLTIRSRTSWTYAEGHLRIRQRENRSERQPEYLKRVSPKTRTRGTTNLARPLRSSGSVASTSVELIPSGYQRMADLNKAG